MKPVLFTLFGLAVGLLINSSLAETRLVRISENVGDYVTTSQQKQNTLDGCFVVVKDLIEKDIKHKKALGITE
jgi:hypothetical protein